jgi:hypothetical protein
MDSKLLGTATEIPGFLRARRRQTSTDGLYAPDEWIVPDSDLGPACGPESAF